MSDVNLRKAIEIVANEYGCSGTEKSSFISDVLGRIFTLTQDLDEQDELRHHQIMEDINPQY